MAATPLSRSCPIRIISVHLLDPADVMAELFAGRVWSFTSEAAHWYAELLLFD